MSNTEHLKKIQEIYIAYYGRPADPEGLEAWAAVLEGAGGDVNAIIDSFATSPEAEVRFGGLSSAEMITQLYNQLFGRDPESQQIIDAWVFQLENNPDVTLQSIALDILSGAREEDAETISSRLAAAQAFTDEIATNDTDGVYRGNLAASIASDWLSGIHASASDLNDALNSIPELIGDLSEGMKSEALNLVVLDGDNGFSLTPAVRNDTIQIVAAGDFNGDGFDDLLIGGPRAAHYATNASGEAYLIFGSEGGTAEFDITSLDGSNGFALVGLDLSDKAGYSVSSAGDVNGDGFDDLLIGAPAAQKLNGSHNPKEGDMYVVFGTDNEMPPIFDLENLNGSNGFRVTGDEENNGAGRVVSSAGDINADGFDDLLVSSYSGVHVIFGHDGIWGIDRESELLPHLELSSLDGSNGFTLYNESESESTNYYSISDTGDVNGDGYSDIIIGLRDAEHDGLTSAGEVYVLFGREGNWDPLVDLNNLDGTNGFILGGTDSYDNLGATVSGAGDINGDGFDDLLINSGAHNNHHYVIFGHGDSWSEIPDLNALNGINGFTVTLSGLTSESMVNAVGDVNNDGFSDLIVSDLTGTSIVVFGHNGYWPSLIGPEATMTSFDPFADFALTNQGFIGDIDGDGLDDIAGVYIDQEGYHEYWSSGQIYYSDSLVQ